MSMTFGAILEELSHLRSIERKGLADAVAQRIVGPRSRETLFAKCMMVKAVASQWRKSRAVQLGQQ